MHCHTDLRLNSKGGGAKAHAQKWSGETLDDDGSSELLKAASGSGGSTGAEPEPQRRHGQSESRADSGSVVEFLH